ncbi:MAG: imidazoleglycerol-phosphate dehydratase HisB [Anaerolineae bacterium]|nr:imidazoleglycerol-phosphate dehydratase HisB [Anaerolineae bacterium]
MRSGTIHRVTNETNIELTLELDGQGTHELVTPVPFLNHLLSHVAVHGLFDLRVRARGDMEVDEHHTVEDIAICLGQALDRALGERKGIVRMGHSYVTMDETLARVVVDLSGRPYAVIQADWQDEMLGTLSTQMVAHFMETLAVHGRLNLHAQVLYGVNDHHKAEALFKGLGRALGTAIQLDPRRGHVPSTKGTLTA